VLPTGDQAAPRCWECEEPTGQPTTVTLRTTQGDVATLTLCARCYRTCYVPLATPDLPGGTILSELDGPS